MYKRQKLILAVLLIFLFFAPISIQKSMEENIIIAQIETNSVILENSTLKGILTTSPFLMEETKEAEKIDVVLTAYSSTTWQTDDTPFITASGSYVEQGIVANNLLPFGTKIKIPEIYGDQIFVVEDRMHPRKGYYHVDIWFSDYDDAVNFGVKETYIEIVES